jgi:hypothetical protein
MNAGFRNGSILIKRQFQARPVTLLIPIDIVLSFLWWRSFTVPITNVVPLP